MEKNDYVTGYWYSPGDDSVGIFPVLCRFTLPFVWDDFDSDDRELAREMMTEAFNEISRDGGRVYFDDEEML